jgi:predicted DNA-binding transcriptional regulator YafY
MLRFAKQQGLFVRSQPLHPTQETIAEDENGIVVRIRVIPSPELTMTILSFGHQVEVVSPTTLREEVSEAIRLAVGHYKA